MSDKIEKIVTLRAPRAKVWHAISDAGAFGSWFGMTLDGPLVEGTRVTGAIAMTQVDDEVARMQEPYVGLPCVLWIERVEPPRRLSFRWHPGAEPDLAPDAPTTVVTFELEDVAEGTRLTITEAGFEALPLDRRGKAFADNEGGWTLQLTLIAKHLARAA